MSDAHRENTTIATPRKYGFLLGSALAAALSLVMALNIAQKLGLPEKAVFPAALAYMVLFSVIIVLLDERRIGQLNEAKTAQVVALEQEALHEEELVNFVQALLTAAAARQQLSLLTSDRRASTLFRLGTGLMFASVLVPFVLVFIYIQAPEPLQVARDLRGTGLPPIEVAKVAQRDWHLLVAGVSFGLLFIAAARGILVAEGRQREVYAREMRETAYYGDLTRALNIAQRLDRKRGDKNEAITDEVIRKVLLLLLERGWREHVTAAPISGDSGGGIPGDHEFLKLMAETVKR